MIKVLKTRIFQKYRTSKFPKAVPELPARFQGLPRVQQSDCSPDCSSCVDICPVGAISKTGDVVDIDLGKCIFCGQCAAVCSHESITFTRDYRMAVTKRSSLNISEAITLERAEELKKDLLRIFKRSIRLRQVSAGGCNACEADVNVLGTIGWDLDRFGIKFVASPRHADGLLITGPVTENMREALIKTYEAIPSPKIVIAAGSCAVSGGLFCGHDETGNGVDEVIPVDLYIPGCPPHPLTILDGLLRILGRI
jgi:Ni,Fe-hydrogenase III small subunit/Pyruvate/2-oxoacid:ferredoxin oxidoreductase delta subunit